MTYKDVVKEVLRKRGEVWSFGNDYYNSIEDCDDALLPTEDYDNRVFALCQLMMIADYYNSKRNEKNDGWEICWNTRRQKYELVSWGECRYGGVRFFCKKDAEEVMNNPEFDKILSSVLKHS